MRRRVLTLLALATLAPAAMATGRAQEPEVPAPAASPAPEPDTRAERLRRLRLAKLQRLAPPRPGFLERNLLAIEKAERPSVLDWNLGGFYPRVQNIARGSEVAAGVRLWKPDLGRTPLDLHASAFHSLNGYEFYDLQAGVLPHQGRRFPPRSTRGDDVYELGDVRTTFASRLTAYGSLRYEHWPETAFYGLGEEASAQSRTTFLLQQASYQGVAAYQAGRHVALGVRAGLRQFFVGPGGEEGVPTTQAVFSESRAPGLTRQPDFFHWAASLLVDGRDEPGNPHRGGMLALSWEEFDDLDSSSHRFRRFGADARAFLPLGSPQRVLALRARVSADRPASGNVVPFYLQETLGGGPDLRAFRTFRFRGEKAVLGQAEYRWEAWPAVELALFADAGRVYGRGEDFSLDGLVHDWGVGLRFKTYEATVFRLDAAWGSEGPRVLARFGAAF
ncbi:MAG TPA: BamA/TamA family outer membrane protein [Vicinamibacteria bacterium]|nr:BamA/TamA family outer membrane protein [Vicinamibacteria bacterium]